MSAATPSAARNADLVVSAEHMLPIAPDNVVLHDAAIAVAGDTIIDMGERGGVLARHPGATHRNLPHHVLLPGLVNAHGHLAMTLLRGLGEGQSLEAWLQETIWPLEGRWVDEDFVADGTLLGMAEMLASGTTTGSDMYYFPETVAELAQIGCRMQVTFPIINHPNAWSQNLDECFERGLKLRDERRSDPLVDVCFGPHSTGTAGEAALRRIAMLADELDAAVHIHLHETKGEVAEARRSLGQSPIETLEKARLLTENLQAVHMTAVSDLEIAMIAECGASVIHCPMSNTKLASGICPVPSFREAGVNVALGTDGAASNNGLDLFHEARMATLLAKLATGDPTALPAAEALEMATLGGARALGMADRIGSLEVGKQADFIAVDVDHPAMQPLHDVPAQLVHTAAGSRVSHAYVAGECRYENGSYPTIDIDELRHRAGIWQGRMGRDA
ncbi:MAG: TRZ/ATZ family hydrolase [Gammaproteobacteria bacterium]|nr:TRZ/ATZ family hydrolase [Gammaproteobacteria bacterium]